MSENDWREIGFDIDLDYQTHKAEWDGFLQTLDPQTACRLCGLDHFPHWLASAPNWQILIEHLQDTYPADMPIREALVRSIQERKPDPKSEESKWWLAMKHVVRDLEVFAYAYSTDQARPASEVIYEETGWSFPAMKA